MPNRPVTLHRWQVVAAFLALCFASMGVAIWNDYRIDQAEIRIVQTKLANAAQDAVRRELLTTLRESDRRACARIEQLKEQNRVDALRQFGQLTETLELLGIESSPAILQRAKEDLARSMERNHPMDCDV